MCNSRTYFLRPTQVYWMLVRLTRRPTALSLNVSGIARPVTVTHQFGELHARCEIQRSGSPQGQAGFILAFCATHFQCVLSFFNIVIFVHYSALYSCSLTFWRRNYFFNFSTLVYKMWIIHEPNTLKLWNKLHFEEEKTEIIHHV